MQLPRQAIERPQGYRFSLRQYEALATNIEEMTAKGYQHEARRFAALYSSIMGISVEDRHLALQEIESHLAEA